LDQVGVGVDCTAAGSPKFFCGEVNASPQAVPWSYVPKAGAAGTFPTGGFYEGGRDDHC
jgi:D-alanine-D-alanine ligase-like ATP-grasp enzyme